MTAGLVQPVSVIVIAALLTMLPWLVELVPVRTVSCSAGSWIYGVTVTSLFFSTVADTSAAAAGGLTMLVGFGLLAVQLPA